MEENELKEIKLSLSQLPTDTINRFMLKLIGSKVVDHYFKSPDNLKELVKILDKNALECPTTAQRLLSLGYVALVENPRALNSIENLVQRVQRIFAKFALSEEVVVATLTLFSILSEQQFYQDQLVRHNVLSGVMTSLGEFSLKTEVLKYGMIILNNCHDELNKSINPKHDLLLKSNLDKMLYDIFNGYEEKILILNTMHFIEKVMKAKRRVLQPNESLLHQILAHVYSTDSVRIELAGYRILVLFCQADAKIKVKLGYDGFLFSLDAKIDKISKCDVDRRLHILRLLACLTDECTDNVLQVLKMRHWHTFIFQTLDQYPDIEFHTLAIDFLSKLVCCNDVRIQRTFILLCLSYTEIIHAVLRSTRRWIRASLTMSNVEFDGHFQRLLSSSISSLSKILSVTEIVEDMKEKIFRYENRFSVFFYRLAETIVYVYRHTNKPCNLAVSSCIKNLLILISEYGEVSDTVTKFFGELQSGQNVYSVRFDDSNLRHNFQRSSSRMFKRLVKDDKDPLPYSILEISVKIMFGCVQRDRLQEVLETFELLFQLCPDICRMMAMSNFLARLKNIYLQHHTDTKIATLVLNLHRILLFGPRAPRLELYFYAVMYDYVEIVEIFSHFTNNTIHYQNSMNLKNEHDPILEKLAKAVDDFNVSQPMKIAETSDSPIEDLFVLACQKSSIGIVRALLTAHDFPRPFIRALVARTDVSNDVKSELLLTISISSTDGRLDWSGLDLDNVTPQFLGSLSSGKRQTVETKQTDITLSLIAFVAANELTDNLGGVFYSQLQNQTPNVDKQVAKEPHRSTQEEKPKFPIELNLSSNKIECLNTIDSESYAPFLKQTQRLYLNRNLFSDVPYQFIAMASNLRELYLDENHFTVIDFSFLNQLQNLKSLSLKDLKPEKDKCVSFVTTSMGQHGLEHLDLSGTQIANMPCHLLTQLQSLRALSMRQCGVGNFNMDDSDETLKLPCLRNANFEENRMTEFSCLNFIFFPSLQILNLNGNQIQYINLVGCIDQCIEDIPEVTQLHLSENNMTCIPAVAFQFAKLTYLDLSKNKIKELSFDHNCRIEAWHQLRHLNLSDNCLSEIPVELSQLDELMMLDISRNDDIITIPNEYGQLRNLFSFRVDGLNQLQIPKDLRPTDGKNVRPMLDFLSQRLRKQVPHSFLKIFMAGKSSATKKAVLQALDPDKFRNVSSKQDQLDVKNFTIGHINITLWDLPFDNMYSTQPFFMIRDM